MSVDRLKRDFLSAANKYKEKYKSSGENPDDLDKFKRLMDIYFHLDDIQEASAGTGTNWDVLIDGGIFTLDNNAIIDAGGFV